MHEQDYRNFTAILAAEAAAAETPEECPCEGHGWVLSPFDTWEPCKVHPNADGSPYDDVEV